jgi:hypothetical protein
MILAPPLDCSIPRKRLAMPPRTFAGRVSSKIPSVQGHQAASSAKSETAAFLNRGNRRISEDGSRCKCAWRLVPDARLARSPFTNYRSRFEGLQMIVDHRTYNIKPGQLNAYLKLYETEALPMQLKYLGHCVGWYVSNDIGPP